MERLSRNIENDIIDKDWFPISISRGGPKISHMLFAEVLTLFAMANRKKCRTILVAPLKISSIEEYYLGRRLTFKNIRTFSLPAVKRVGPHMQLHPRH